MRAGRAAVLGIAALSLTGCVRGCASSRPPIHIVPNMDYQEKLQAQEESRFFYDGAGMRKPVAGTVARGHLHARPELVTGKDAAGKFLAANPLEVTPELERRGAERYAIYCQPCHDARGNGRGVLYTYGKVPTASFYDAKLKDYPDGQFFDVITNGTGLMPSYAWPIPPEDRWAIVAHVRQLQRERQAMQVATAAQP